MTATLAEETCTTSVFEAVLVRDGRAAEAHYCEPFDLLFSSPRFEYRDLAGDLADAPPLRFIASCRFGT